MPTVATLLAAAALLAVPGPTNVLLAAAGAAGGLRAGLRLGAVAACGYLVAVTVLTVVAGPAVAASPILSIALKGAACAWLLVCAARLWRHAGAFGPSVGAVRAVDVLVTTLLNPKGLVFAFGLAPSDTTLLPGFLATLAVLTVAACVAWAGLGALATRGMAGHLTPRRLDRGGALVLTGFAAALGVSVLG